MRLNAAPALDTPRPILSPATAGHWTDLGDYEFFRPASTLEPCATYKLTIPAGTAAAGHRRLGHSRTVSFNVACPGITAVQEALARLNYLPYALHGFVGASSVAPLTRAQAARRAFDLPDGVLLANAPAAPPLQIGKVDATTTGALEVFEEDHGLPLGTAPTQQLWTELLADETLAKQDPRPYTWVTVTETIPETLEVHENNRIALKSLANTGVPGRATQQGIFPIYVRYVATTMIGTNVDGSHYDDPGVPWVNYFNGGDAVHGYIRPTYGVPQSNGCVELPIATAEVVYGMLPGRRSRDRRVGGFRGRPRLRRAAGDGVSAPHATFAAGEAAHRTAPRRRSPHFPPRSPTAPHGTAPPLAPLRAGQAQPHRTAPRRRSPHFAPGKPNRTARHRAAARPTSRRASPTAPHGTAR